MIHEGSRIREYEVKEKIGTGRYGTAYKVYSTKYLMEFCMKVISNNDTSSDPFTAFLFKKEAETLKKVGHLNVIRLYDYFSEDGNFYIVTELCSLGTLENYLQNKGVMSSDELRTVFSPLIEALAFIHSMNIVHRDIKPANIGFDRLWRPKLIDWGYSTEVKEGEILTSYCGSFPYVCPECLKKVPYDGKRCDIWAFGVTLYVMAFGKIPWGENIPQNEILTNLVNANFVCPTEDIILSDLITRLIRVQPDLRLTAAETMKHPFFGSRAICRPLNVLESHSSNVITYKNSKKKLNSHMLSMRKISISPLGIYSQKKDVDMRIKSSKSLQIPSLTPIHIQE